MLLNKNQKKAVDYNEGPLLIIAGAGTGKTTVITEKIKTIIAKKIVKPEEILALTFTEKAVHEMEERVDKIIPYGYFQMWISTFHSFADTVLKESAHHIGLSNDFHLMTEAESIIFFKKNLFSFKFNYFRPLGNPNKFVKDILKHFNRLKNESIDENEYQQWIKDKFKSIKKVNPEEKIELEKYRELVSAYSLYQKLKLRGNVMDFSDLIFYLIKLFKKRPNILKKYQKQFKFVLIDEFQDTNIAQYILIKLLCPSKTKPHLTVVGDDSQAIYKFRGASISNIITFMKDYPHARQIVLNKNYRSNQKILDHAYQLIQKNNPDTLEYRLGISKNLAAVKKNKGKIEFVITQNVDEEAKIVIDKIKLLSKEYKYSEMAVLVRANNHSQPFVREFIRQGIPYQFLGAGMLFKQSEVKDLIAYLKVIYNLEDSVSFFRVLSMDIFSLDKKDINLLNAFAKKTTQSLFQSIEIYLSFFYKKLYMKEFEIYKKYLPFLKEETREKLLKVYKMIKRHLGFINKLSAGQILYYFLEDSGYLSSLVNFKSVKEEKIALNVSKFFDQLKSFESEHEDASVPAVVEFLEMSIELGESPTTNKNDIELYNAVNISTIHKVKGLEFSVVFLVNLTKGRFPSRRRKDKIAIPEELIKETLPTGDYHLQEERRLFYVGLTRAKDSLYLTTSKYYGKGKRLAKISPFVAETIGEKKLLDYIKIKNEAKKQLSIFDFKEKKELVIKKKKVTGSFSYSQINTFQFCPLKYKYSYILKVPTNSFSAASFGESVHKTLQKFYQEFKLNKKTGEKRLLQIYKNNWIPIGYQSKEHQLEMFRKGKKMLEGYFKKMHSQRIKIIDLEKFFRLKIDQDIIIKGKIDRVDLIDNNKIEIIDYKTGKRPSDRKIKKDLQLSIYALAAVSKNLYQKNIKDITFSFYFIKNLEKVSINKTKSEIDGVVIKLKEIVKKIRESDFQPNKGQSCNICPFKSICPAWQA